MVSAAVIAVVAQAAATTKSCLCRPRISGDHRILRRPLRGIFFVLNYSVLYEIIAVDCVMTILGVYMKLRCSNVIAFVFLLTLSPFIMADTLIAAGMISPSVKIDRANVPLLVTSTTNGLSWYLAPANIFSPMVASANVPFTANCIDNFCVAGGMGVTPPSSVIQTQLWYSQNSGVTWLNATIPTSATLGGFFASSCASAETGNLCVVAGVGNKNRGLLLASQNAGATWNSISIPGLDIYTNFNNVSCVNSNSANATCVFAGCIAASGNGHCTAPQLAVSTNNGVTGTVATLPSAIANAIGTVSNVSCTLDTTGKVFCMAVGRTQVNNVSAPFVLVNNDTTGTGVWTSTSPTTEQIQGQFDAVSCVTNPVSGVVCVVGGKQKNTVPLLYTYTNNQSTPWTNDPVTSSDTTQFINAVSCAAIQGNPSVVCVASILDNNLAGSSRLLVSNDGAALTWTEQPIWETYNVFMDVKCVPQVGSPRVACIAVGFNGDRKKNLNATTPILYNSIDNGISWIPYPLSNIGYGGFASAGTNSF